MTGLPRGWSLLRLKEVAASSKNLDPSKFSDEQFELYSVPSYSVGVPEVVFGRDIGSAKQEVRPGDVLLCKIIPHLVRVWVVPKQQHLRQIASSEWIVYRNHGCDPNYLRRALMDPEFRQRFMRTKTGVGGSLTRARPAAVNDIEIPLAPFEEQQRIVTKLEGAMSRTARARAELARIPSLIAYQKRAILAAALSGELTNQWRANAGIPAGEEITATIETPYRYEVRGAHGWPLKTFNDLCKIEGGSQPPKSTFAYDLRPGFIRFIQIRDYKSDDHITYIPRDLARRFCSESDIMIARYGPPVWQILRGIEGAYNVALMKAVPREGVSREYLYWYLQHPVLRAYVELDAKRTAGQDGVNKDHLEKFPAFVPPLEEQIEIVRRIESAFAWLDKVTHEHAQATRLLDHLDQALLTKAFRGELVPQDPADEPAATLLARISAARESSALPARKRKASA